MDRLILPVLTSAAGAAIADLAARDLEVIAVAIDLGGGAALDAVRDAALSAGARRCHVVDRREALAEGVLWPALRCGALAAPGAPIHTALSMPVVAAVVAEIAVHEAASAVAVWADDPLDRQRLRALLKSVAPTAGLVAVTGGSAAAGARNLWASVVPAADGPAPDAAPAASSGGGARVTLGFERGLPVQVSGVSMPPAEIIESVATIAAAHGVGPFTVRDAESSRAWTVDAPGAVVLQAAMRIVTARVVDARTADLLDGLASAYADLVRDGAWHSPARAGIEAAVDRVLAAATGDVTLTITEGRIQGDA
jgi:argininosuccinate synthase